MKSAAVVLAALLCTSCGGGSSEQTGSSMASPPSAAAAATSPSAGNPAPMPPASSAPAPSAPAPPPPQDPPASPAPASYRIVEVPRLAPTGSITASAVNDHGIVVGNQETSTSPRAWMYEQSSGALNELTFEPSETGAAAGGISNTGTIAGYEIDANTASIRAGFWTAAGGAMLLTGQYQEFTQALAANDSGAIIGNFGESGSISSLPLLWSGPEYAQTVLPGLRCDQCDPIMISANAINDAGTIVGSSNASVYNGGQYVSGGIYAVEWQSGNITSLGALQGASYSAAFAVDGGGDVVGSSRVGVASGAPSHAFLYRQGAMLDLGTLDGDTDSSANSINDGGQIVGRSENTAVDDSARAFLYESGHIYDLNTLIDPADPLAGSVRLQEAVSISSNGLIAANGTDDADPGWQRAFLLIPSQ